MKRIKLTVAYDGTNYCGWQIQQNGITVEGIINSELSRLLKEDIKIIGASRTDSGVHARGNVAVFDTGTRMPAEKISYALNQSLPDDIVVLRSNEVSADFHPRYNSSQKTYEYSIYNASFPLPTERLYSHYTYNELDIDKMREAAEYLVGEHDFKSFCSSGAQVKTTVRTIYNIEIIKEPFKIEAPDQEARKYLKEPGKIYIRITGNGFLYNMVRIIAGTLMEAGQGKFPPAYMKEIIDAGDRTKAGPTARACGLTLLEIQYDIDNETP